MEKLTKSLVSTIFTKNNVKAGYTLNIFGFAVFEFWGLGAFRFWGFQVLGFSGFGAFRFWARFQSNQIVCKNYFTTKVGNEQMMRKPKNFKNYAILNIIGLKNIFRLPLGYGIWES